MAIYKRDIVDIDLESGSIHRSFISQTIGSGDNSANKFGVRTFRDGVPEDLSGASCQAVFMNAEGTNIALTSYGTVSGNEAYVTLPQACYNVEGQFTLAIKLVKGGETVTSRIVDGIVCNTGTTGTVAPTESVPTYQEILDVYDAMLSATSAANLAIAEDFDATKYYPAYKYVINNGALYRITKPHEKNVTWANTAKDEVKIGDEVTKLDSAISMMPNANICVFNNYYLDKNGIFQAMNGYHVGLTDAIEGETFVISGCGYHSTYYAWNFLDEDKSIIAHDVYRADYTYVENEIVVAPKGARYIAVNIGENNQASDLVCRKVMTDTDYSYLSGDNSYLLSDCGVIHENTFYDLRENALTVNATMQMIMSECQEGDVFKLSGTSYNNNYAAYVFMDASNNIIDKAANFISGQVTKYENYFVTAPANAAYIYVSGSKEVLGEENVYLKKLFKRNDPHSEFLMFDSVLSGGELKKNTYFNSSAQYVTLAGYNCYEIPCQEGDVFLVSCRGYSGTYYAWNFVNSSGAIIDHAGSRYQINLSFRNNYLTAPENAAKLVLNSGENDVHLKCIKNGADAALNLDAQSAESNTWFKGKKIVWFGTSIPAGKVNGVSYPEIVAAKLGATVYNEALGSSPMSSGVPVNASRLRALSLTYAEKQAQSWWSELTDAEKTIAMNSSFDYKVTKYLTGGSVGPCDLYVFDHGYNDYYYPDPSTYMEEPTNPNDKSYALGAANFLVNAILQDNPRARIVWIGHYENALLDPTDHQSWGKPVAVLQEYISEKYGIPLCRTWENTGWSNPHKITTTGYWSNGIWHNSGGTSRQDYVKNCAFADGIHPNTDLSGESTNKMAEIITAWLRGVFD